MGAAESLAADPDPIATLNAMRGRNGGEQTSDGGPPSGGRQMRGLKMPWKKSPRGEDGAQARVDQPSPRLEKDKNAPKESPRRGGLSEAPGERERRASGDGVTQMQMQPQARAVAQPRAS